MKDDSIKNPFEPIINFFSRYNLVIFIIVIVVGLTVSILTLNDILTIPFKEKEGQSNQSQVVFDEAALSKINLLNPKESNNYNETSKKTRNIFSE